MTVRRCSELCVIVLGVVFWSPPFVARAQVESGRDSDMDGVLDEDELPGDSDGDGTLDRLDPDDDGDTVSTRHEYGGSGQIVDHDRDNTPDYLDADDDGDALRTKDEQPDADGDGDPRDARQTTPGVADFLNADDDDDKVTTRTERPNDSDRDSDSDGLPDHRDVDDDGDGRSTLDETRGGLKADSDFDGLADSLDIDDDGDGIPTREECAVFAVIDLDHDGYVNCLDIDADGDLVADALEGAVDGDGDGVLDYLDPGTSLADADADGVPDIIECPTPESCPDTDSDGTPDLRDVDDDGDGRPTREETRGTSLPDSDGDELADYLDYAEPTPDAGGSDAGSDGAARDDIGWRGLDGSMGMQTSRDPATADEGGITFVRPGRESGCAVRVATKGSRSSSWDDLMILLLTLLALRCPRKRRPVASAAA